MNPAYPASLISYARLPAPDTLGIFASYFIPKEIVPRQKKLRSRLHSYKLPNGIRWTRAPEPKSATSDLKMTRTSMKGTRRCQLQERSQVRAPILARTAAKP